MIVATTGTVTISNRDRTLQQRNDETRNNQAGPRIDATLKAENAEYSMRHETRFREESCSRARKGKKRKTTGFAASAKEASQLLPAAQ